MMTVYAGTSADDIAGLADITVDELKRAAGDMSETEVTRARTQMKAGILMGLESPSSRAERLARIVGIWGRIPPLSETITKIDAVDVAQVREFAESLAGAQAAMALYGPVEKAHNLEHITRRLAA
jgi:predicted Zn-dependent peptidase